MTNKPDITGAIHEAIEFLAFLEIDIVWQNNSLSLKQLKKVITKLQAVLDAVPEDREPDESDCPYEIAYTDGYNEGLYLIQKITKEVE